MLFLTFWAGLGTPNPSWMIAWCVLGLLLSDRSGLTFVVPLLATLLGAPEVAVGFIAVVWVLELLGVYLFSSKERTEVGRIDVWWNKMWGLPVNARAASAAPPLSSDTVVLRRNEGDQGEQMAPKLRRKMRTLKSRWVDKKPAP